jgi:Tol biopolymer transport system component
MSNSGLDLVAATLLRDMNHTISLGGFTMKSRGIALLAGLAALMVAGVIAGAGAAGTNGLAGGNIVYAGLDPKDGVSDVYVMKADGSVKTNITDSDATRKDVTPELSRDGSSVVFVRHYASGKTNLMVVKANGSGLMDVTPPAFDVQNIADPSWSPNGSQIAFSSNVDGNYDLYLLDLASGLTSKLTSTRTPVQNLDPAWSPNGKTIVFSRSGISLLSAAAGLFELRLDSATRPVQLTKTTKGNGDVDPVYSPDGTRIAFSSDRAGNDDVYFLNRAAFAVTKMTSTKDRDVQPTFSPDGTAFAYVSDRSGATEIWAQSLMTLTPGLGSAIQLTFDGTPKSHPSWGPEAALPLPPPLPVPPGTDPAESADSLPAATSRGPLPPIAVAPPAA